jgi:hypothetical protein
MVNKIFDRITKTMAILLALCFVLSVTAVSVNAAAFEQRNKFYDHTDKYKHGDKHGHDYRDGNNHGQDYRDIDKYEQGYKDGYNEGFKDGIKDCIKYGSKEFIRKIPDPPNKDNRYRAGFIQGYTIGYHEKRYACLRK